MTTTTKRSPTAANAAAQTAVEEAVKKTALQVGREAARKVVTSSARATTALAPARIAMQYLRLFLVFAAAPFAPGAAAFCVYNETNQTIYVFEQTELSNLFKGMVSTVKAGGEGCCNWQTRDCNPNGHSDSKIEFQIEVGVGHSSCFVGAYDAVHGNTQTLPKIDANAYIKVLNNPKFDKSKAAASTNPRWVAYTFTHDDKLVSKFGCPGYTADKPGLMDFL